MPDGVTGANVNPDIVGLTTGRIGYEEQFFARMDAGQVSGAIIESEPVYGGAEHRGAVRGGRPPLGDRGLPTWRLLHASSPGEVAASFAGTTQ